MPTTEQKLVNQIFQDIALLLGGAIVLRRHEISDDLVWEIAKDLQRLHSQYIQEAKGKEHKADLEPHPAIAELLRKIQLSKRQGQKA